MELMRLPPELLFRIALNLQLTNVPPLALVNWFWAATLTQQQFWKDKFRYDYGPIEERPEDWKERYRTHCRVWGAGQIPTRLDPPEERPDEFSARFTRVSPFRAKFISAGFESDGFIDLNDNVLVLGSNYFGELAQGDLQECEEATPVLLKGLPLKGKFISTGGRHTLGIDPYDQVWAFGNNGEGQLGMGSVKEAKSPVYLGVVAKSVSAGLFHSALIDMEDRVWIWGQNLNGNLGLGHTEKVLAPALLGRRAKQVCCGDGYTLLLDFEGEVWGCGTNGHGQLGLGHFHSINEWKRIPQHKFKRISTKTYHSLGIDLEGRVWGWGQNDVGQLGIPNLGKFCQPILTTMKGRDVSAGQVHSLILEEDRRVWVMGGNYYGQLGVGDTRHKDTPQKIFLHSAKMISAGANQSYFLQH